MNILDRKELKRNLMENVEHPHGMRREDLGKKSVRRNRLIADMFHRLREVEMVGSGIGRMKEEMAARG